MKTLLNMRNLMATHYDNGDHVLEFYACGMVIYVTARGVGPIEDPDFWDDEDNLRTAIASVNADDIDVYMYACGKTYKMVNMDSGIIFEPIQE